MHSNAVFHEGKQLISNRFPVGFQLVQPWKRLEMIRKHSCEFSKETMRKYSSTLTLLGHLLFSNLKGLCHAILSDSVARKLVLK